MELTIENANRLLLDKDLPNISIQQLFETVRDNETMNHYRPDPICQLDPRSGNMVLFNSSRSRRPSSAPNHAVETPTDQSCPICAGRTTPILDIRQHSEGFSFVNFNLFPIVYPTSSTLPDTHQEALHPDPEHVGRYPQGLHLLQWTNSIHQLDWHNMPLDDLEISMQQLADVEGKLLRESTDLMPRAETDSDTYGYCSIIKNYGAAAGASQAHGHLQIGFTNIMPQRFFDNMRFRQRHDMTFTQYMLEENPASLTAWETEFISLMVPYFMRRPYSVLLMVKDTSKQYLHELSAPELRDLTEGISLTIRSLHEFMEGMDLEASFQLAVQNGPGAGLYVEFFPQTQLLGGFEQLGLWICQSSAEQCAEDYRNMINNGEI